MPENERIDSLLVEVQAQMRCDAHCGASVALERKHVFRKGDAHPVKSAFIQPEAEYIIKYDYTGPAAAAAVNADADAAAAAAGREPPHGPDMDRKYNRLDRRHSSSAMLVLGAGANEARTVATELNEHGELLPVFRPPCWRRFLNVVLLPLLGVHLLLSKIGCLLLIVIIVAVNIIRVLLDGVVRLWLLVLAITMVTVHRARFDATTPRVWPAPGRSLRDRMEAIAAPAGPADREPLAQLLRIVRDPEFVRLSWLRRHLVVYQVLKEDPSDFATHLNVFYVLSKRQEDRAVVPARVELSAARLPEASLSSQSHSVAGARRRREGGCCAWSCCTTRPWLARLRPPSQFVSTSCILILFVHPILLRGELEMFHCTEVPALWRLAPPARPCLTHMRVLASSGPARIGWRPTPTCAATATSTTTCGKRPTCS
jgi:hypothetical protein